MGHNMTKEEQERIYEEYRKIEDGIWDWEEEKKMVNKKIKKDLKATKE